MAQRNALLDQLQVVADLFPVIGRTFPSPETVLDEIKSLLHAARDDALVASADRKLLKRRMLLLARRIVELEADCSPRQLPFPQLIMTVEWACSAIRVLAALGTAIEASLASQDCFQLASSLRIAYRTGRRALREPGEAVRGVPPLPSLTYSCLSAVFDMLVLLLRVAQPPELEHFMSSLAGPLETAEFLEALAAAAALSLHTGAEGVQLLNPPMLLRLTSLLSHVLHHRAFRHASSAITARPTTQAAIVNLLLSHVLPRAADGLPSAQFTSNSSSTTSAPTTGDGAGAEAGASGANGRGRRLVHGASVDWGQKEDAPLGLVMDLGALLSCPALQPAVQLYCRQPGAVAALAHAVQVARALPPEPPASMPRQLYGTLVTQGAAGVLGMLSLSISSEAGAEDGAGADSAVAVALQRARAAAGGAAAAAAAGPRPFNLAEEQVAAAWMVVRAVPSLADLLRVITKDRGMQCHVAPMVVYLRCVGYLLQDLPRPGVADSAQQAADLVAAADAAVRLVPLLTRLDSEWMQLLSAGQRAEAAAEPTTPPLDIMILLWQNLWYGGTIRVFNWANSHRGRQAATALVTSSPAETAALPTLLFQLHTSSCRFFHLLASCRTHPLIMHGGRSEDWRVATHVLHLQLRCGVDFSQTVVAGMPEPEGAAAKVAHDEFLDRMRLYCRAMSVAHMSAMRAAAATRTTLLPQPGHEGGHAGPRSSIESEAEALVTCASQLPHLLDEPLGEAGSPGNTLLEALVAQLHWRAPDGRMLSKLLIAAGMGSQPRLAAALAHSGLLAACLHSFDLLIPVGKQRLYHCFASLRSGAAHVAEELADDVRGTSSEEGRARAQLAEQLVAAEQRLATCIAEVAPQLADAVDGGARLGGQAVWRAAEAAASVGSLLRTFYQLPEQLEEARILRARAAVARSCAYLRCSNLEGTGGSAAGEGKGSKRCSKCRAAWYCGTACSHADWRAGGHKRVCASLGIVRDVERRIAAFERSIAAE